MNSFAKYYLRRKGNSHDMPDERYQMDYGRDPRYYDEPYKRMIPGEYVSGMRDFGRERQYSGYFGDVPFGMRTRYPDDYMPRDYGHKEHYPEDFMRLSRHDVEKWGKMLKNSDGTSGIHFTKDQINQAISQFNINKKDIDDETLFMAVNMIYSDYCKVMRKYGVDRIEVYIDLALAFLNDEDFNGSFAEKLALYYRCIADE